MPEPTYPTVVVANGTPPPMPAVVVPETLADDAEEYGATVAPQTFIEGRGALMMTIALCVIGLLLIRVFGTHK